MSKKKPELFGVRYMKNKCLEFKQMLEDIISGSKTHDLDYLYREYEYPITKFIEIEYKYEHKRYIPEGNIEEAYRQACQILENLDILEPSKRVQMSSEYKELFLKEDKTEDDMKRIKEIESMLCKPIPGYKTKFLDSTCFESEEKLIHSIVSLKFEEAYREDSHSELSRYLKFKSYPKPISIRLCNRYHDWFEFWWNPDKFHWGQASEYLVRSCSKYFTTWWNPDKFNWCYSYLLPRFCGDHFETWWDPDRFNWNSGSKYLARYCSRYFDKWWCEKFVWSSKSSFFLMKFCRNHFDVWWDPSKSLYSNTYLLSVYCIEYFDKWFPHIRDKVDNLRNRGFFLHMLIQKKSGPDMRQWYSLDLVKRLLDYNSIHYIKKDIMKISRYLTETEIIELLRLIREKLHLEPHEMEQFKKLSAYPKYKISEILQSS